MTVTLSGAIGSTSYTLDYSGTNSAYTHAQGYINLIDSTYASAYVYDPSTVNPHFGAIIIGDAVANNVISVTGFGAVIDENNTTTSTVNGGGDQIVLAGTGGITYTSSYGNATVDAGGGNNFIQLSQDMQGSLIYTGGGNDTIYTAQGDSTVRAGGGFNETHLGAGNDKVLVGGDDTVYAGSGHDRIRTTPFGHVTIVGAVSSSVKDGFSLNFVGGNLSSVVESGAGRYSIFGGAGGGFFQGGSFGGNYIQGGTGAVTIMGSQGGNDTLLAGAGNSLIEAGHGNETLGGGTGHTIFDLDTSLTKNEPGAVIKITDFGSNDLLQLSGGAAAIDQALHSYNTALGTAFTLQDGTQVVLVGYHNSLNDSNFKH